MSQPLQSLAKTSPSSSRKAEDVATIFLFVPNIIGYVRIILLAVSLEAMSRHPRYSATCYFVSSMLDMADGFLARRRNETSRLGAALDLCVDRVATTALCCYLCMTYPRAQLIFQALIASDWSSHYFHTIASLSTGQKSHKAVSKSRSRILNLYYTNRHVLVSLCAANEAFFVSLYLAAYYTVPFGLGRILPAALVEVLPKDIVRLVYTITWPQLLAVATAPGMLIKQIINVVQLGKAAIQIAELDVEERAAARQSKAA